MAENEVRQGQTWREGSAGPVWTVEARAGGPVVTLVRWVPGERGPERREREVAWSVLHHGDGGWAPTSRLEAREEESRLEHEARAEVGRGSGVPEEHLADGPTSGEALGTPLIDTPQGAALSEAAARVPGEGAEGQFGPGLRARGMRPCTVTRASLPGERCKLLEGHEGPHDFGDLPVSEVLARERELLEQALRADPAFTWAMQSVEGRESLDVPATLLAIREVRKFLLMQSGRVLGLVEAAEGHLSELYGPAFDAWRCDECGLVLEDRLVRRAAAGERSAFARIAQARLVSKADSPRAVEYLECCAGGAEHGPMRHVQCRVTADSPESDRTEAI